MDSSSTILSSTESSIPSITASASTSVLPSITSSPSLDPVPAHHASPVVAFIIGLAIVILASILNAAGLNLTKLDHVRTSAIPKASRRRDWLRPLWLLGMILYILSQLLGSTLALDYMRAEYVAPLGSTSLIFNFLFAKFLVNTPVTRNDIYGTVVVIIGVIGIVAFGSINSGLSQETNAAHLSYLWSRGNWLAYFIFMTFAFIALYIFVSQLDAVLAARSDISAVPFSGMGAGRASPPAATWAGKAFGVWDAWMSKIKEYLEIWTAPHDETRIAWTLGIGWACCGGGLAGGCLVFAKAAVKLISGSLSHENTGNQFGQASSIVTFIFLAITAVLQIICLNRGLKVYDSTLVVPVFYGVYTAFGFLNSLIFNDEVDAYESWALFLIFVSILTLVSGVVLLTHKKPDPNHGHPHSATPGSAAGGTSIIPLSQARRRSSRRKSDKDSKDPEEGEALHDRDLEGGDEVLWQVGDASDDEDEDFVPRNQGLSEADGRGERQRILADQEDDEPLARASTSSDATLTRPEAEGSGDEFGNWKSR
ncbi:hypothetical protein QCA50_021078 [Cerrena zonata]|uniref:Uncharacterized protein n=1 Tax=Cerrena zonata TaxID=2478898 RepID=A0AAW0FBB0_9APHY